VRRFRRFVSPHQLGLMANFCTSSCFNDILTDHQFCSWTITMWSESTPPRNRAPRRDCFFCSKQHKSSKSSPLEFLQKMQATQTKTMQAYPHLSKLLLNKKRKLSQCNRQHHRLVQCTTESRKTLPHSLHRAR